MYILREITILILTPSFKFTTYYTHISMSINISFLMATFDCINVTFNLNISVGHFDIAFYFLLKFTCYFFC